MKKYFFSEILLIYHDLNISKQHQKQTGELMMENKFHKEKTKHFETRCAELLEDNKKLAQQIDDLSNIKNKGEFGK